MNERAVTYLPSEDDLSGRLMMNAGGRELGRFRRGPRPGPVRAQVRSPCPVLCVLNLWGEVVVRGRYRRRVSDPRTPDLFCGVALRSTEESSSSHRDCNPHSGRGAHSKEIFQRSELQILQIQNQWKIERVRGETPPRHL